MKINNLLVDIKNMMYRAIYAGHADKNFNKDYIVLIFKFFKYYYDKFMPDSVHIFWDPPKEDIWRRKLLNEYKDGRNYNKYDIDIKSEIEKLSKKCKFIFKNMGFYQYYKNDSEADDLIFAFCKLINNGDNLIISSDSDMTQIPYNFKNTYLHNPLNKKVSIVNRPNVDPTTIKALCGDNSDNIEGFKGIGKVKSNMMANDIIKLIKFLNENDNWDKFELNKKLIDLSLNPNIFDNMKYVLSVICEKPSKNYNIIKKIVYKINGLNSVYNNCIYPFKYLKGFNY